MNLPAACRRRLLFIAALLSAGALLPTPIHLGTVALSTAFAANGSCVASLHLTLQPGQHFPSAVSQPIPSDIPPGPIQLKLPLYPGAVPTTETQTMPSFSIPMTAYMKSASAMYRTTADTNTLISWYTPAFESCGYRPKGSQTSGNRTGTVSQGIDFERTKGRNTFDVDLSFETSKQGGTLILYVVIALTPPVYPVPGSILRVPGHPISVTITRYSGGNGGLRPLRTVDVRDQAAVRALAQEIDDLPKLTSVNPFCPFDNGSHDTLVFTDADASQHVVRIDLSGCRIVSAPPAPPGRLYDDKNLLPHVNALLKRGHPDGFLYDARTLKPTGIRRLAASGRFLSMGQTGDHVLYLSGTSLFMTRHGRKQFLARRVADAGFTINDDYAIVRHIGAAVSHLSIVNTKTDQSKPFPLPAGSVLLGRNAGAGTSGLSDALSCNLQYLDFRLGRTLREIDPKQPTADYIQTAPFLSDSNARRLIAVSCSGDLIAVYRPGKGITVRSVEDAAQATTKVTRRIAAAKVTFLSWSPNERYLAYRAGNALHVVDLQTGHRHVMLRLGPATIWGASWDPWNRILALSLEPTSAPSSRSRLVLVDRDNRATGPLPLPFAGAGRVEWSPWQGRSLAMTRITPGGDQPWIVSLPSALPPDPAGKLN